MTAPFHPAVLAAAERRQLDPATIAPPSSPQLLRYHRRLFVQLWIEDADEAEAAH